MDTHDINLYKSAQQRSQAELLLIGRLKFFSIVVALIFVVISVVVTVSYFAARLRFNNLEEQQTQLVQSLNNQAKKQLLLSNIKDRIPLITKTLDSELSWNDVADNILQMAVPPFLESVTLDQKNTITLVAGGSSLDDINTMVQTALSLEKQKKIRTAQIDSLHIDEKGVIEIRLSYIPML